jgi:sarcosine/dimethylglycine N-methyltransferase
VLMGADFPQLTANLARNLIEGRLDILSAVFESAPINPHRRPNVAGTPL